MKRKRRKKKRGKNLARGIRTANASAHTRETRREGERERGRQTKEAAQEEHHGASVARETDGAGCTLAEAKATGKFFFLLHMAWTLKGPWRRLLEALSLTNPIRLSCTSFILSSRRNILRQCGTGLAKSLDAKKREVGK